MKINQMLHGFTVNKITEIEEISATLVQMTHRCGARLNFLDREDENKTFSITFKTIPEDSTGVFHIIEHSVLCGSEKYPVKEPFVELLKGSLNTFLNAMTFPDKTMYPVSSRNDKDFLNLMSVYLDAVLHPAILKNPNIFRQEGWHYELDSSEGSLSRSGVVLNEMKGAFSSPDELASYHITNMLYKDTCYRHDSGGKPDVIPDLTYEKFLEAHKKYYHPSNSEIFLDGSVNLDASLALIDSFLSPYERVEMNIDIPDQPPLKSQRREIEYEIATFEDMLVMTKVLTSGKDDYHLLISDVLAVGMTGIEAAEELRRLGEKVPIVFVSSTAEYAMEGCPMLPAAMILVVSIPSPKTYIPVPTRDTHSDGYTLTMICAFAILTRTIVLL